MILYGTLVTHYLSLKLDKFMGYLHHHHHHHRHCHQHRHYHNLFKYFVFLFSEVYVAGSSTDEEAGMIKPFA